MKKSTPAGFSVIETLVVLVVVGVLVLTGWFVWHSKQSSDSSPHDTATSQSKSSKKPATKKPDTKYLVISEWHVKLPLDNESSDAYYEPYGTQSTDTTYALGSRGLTVQDANCAPGTSGGVGLLVRQTAAQHDANKKLMNPITSPVYPYKVGDYYYNFIGSQTACSSNVAVGNVQSELKPAFIRAFEFMKVVP